MAKKKESITDNVNIETLNIDSSENKNATNEPIQNIETVNNCLHCGKEIFNIFSKFCSRVCEIRYNNYKGSRQDDIKSKMRR